METVYSIPLPYSFVAMSLWQTVYVCLQHASYLHANDYVISKPKMKELLSRSNGHNSVYVHLLLSNDAFDKYEEQKNLVDAIQCEAVSTCTRCR